MSEARLAGSYRAFSWGYISKKLIMGRNMGALMFMVAGLLFVGVSSSCEENEREVHS